MSKYLTYDQHYTDEDGNPAGGSAGGAGLAISYQNGPLVVDGVRKTPNGAFVEALLEAAISRLEFFNSTRFKCRENSLAITHLEEALHWLNHRTAKREEQGVEGTHQLHE